MHNTPEEEGTAPHHRAFVGKVAAGGGLDVLNPAWRPRTRTYELCRNCGVKYLLHDGQRL